MIQASTQHIVTTQIDSLHTQVNVIDTTVTHVHVYDTIVTHVYSTVPPDLIAVYEKLITAQDDKYEFLLGAVAIIVTVLVVFVTVSNILISKKLIKHDFKKSFEKEKIEIKKALNDLNKKYHRSKGESSRLFANSNSSNYALNLGWWSECVKEYTLADRESAIKKSTLLFLKSIKTAFRNKEQFLIQFKNNAFTFNKMRNNLKYIPNLISEKEEILEKLDELESYCKQTDPNFEDCEVVKETK